MKELWEFCRKLSNPERMDLLRHIYVLKGDGMCVNEATENVKLGQSGTSQYLKQLHELGLLRRERGGRLVGYYADSYYASPAIQEIAILLYKRFQKKDCDMSFMRVMKVMGHAFRARVVNYIAMGGDGGKEALANRYGKEIRFITRDLQPAVEIGLLEVDAEDSTGTYRYVAPADEIARRIVELSR